MPKFKVGDRVYISSNTYAPAYPKGFTGTIVDPSLSIQKEGNVCMLQVGASHIWIYEKDLELCDNKIVTAFMDGKINAQQFSSAMLTIVRDQP